MSVTELIKSDSQAFKKYIWAMHIQCFPNSNYIVAVWGEY